jgi:hypothetical protein
VAGCRVTATYDNARFVRSAIERLHRLGVDDDQIDIRDDEDFEITVEEDLPATARITPAPAHLLSHRHPVLTVEVDSAPGEPIEELVQALSPGSVLVARDGGGGS